MKNTFDRLQRVGIVISRIGGEDGVSLESMHWMRIFMSLGLDVVVFTGARSPSHELDELEERGVEVSIVPEADPAPSSGARLRTFAALFDPERRDLSVLDSVIEPEIETLVRELDTWIEHSKIDVVVLENFTLPWHQYALGAAVARVVAQRQLPAVCRGHDFPDDREDIYHWAQAPERLRSLVNEAFVKSAVHVTINDKDRRKYYEPRGIDPAEIEVIPNTIDLHDDRLLPLSDDRKSELRRLLLDQPEQKFVLLAPVRPVARKRLDVALAFAKLVRRRHPEIPLCLMVTHDTVDATPAELEALRVAAAGDPAVELVFAHDALSANVDRSFNTWDVYQLADACAYFSDYEGYGNGLLEALAFRLPTYVNRYQVLDEEISKYHDGAGTSIQLPSVAIPPQYPWGRFAEWAAAGDGRLLEWLPRFEAGASLVNQLDGLVEDLAALLRAKSGPGGELPDPWLGRAATNLDILKRYNSHEVVGQQLRRVLRRSQGAKRPGE